MFHRSPTQNPEGGSGDTLLPSGVYHRRRSLKGHDTPSVHQTKDASNLVGPLPPGGDPSSPTIPETGRFGGHLLKTRDSHTTRSTTLRDPHVVTLPSPHITPFPWTKVDPYKTDPSS